MLGRAVGSISLALVLTPIGCRGKSAPEQVPAPGAARIERAAAAPPSLPRLHPRVLRAWVQAEPSRTSARLGYLRVGSAVSTAGPPVNGADCPGGWYPVQPKGFVCAGSAATLDERDAVVRAAAGLGPDLSRRLPYIYGTVRRPGPIYARVPTSAELSSAEPDLEQRMESWLTADGEIGASYAQHVWLGGAGEPPDPALLWRERRSEPLPAFLESLRPPALGDDRRADELVLARMKPKVGFSLLKTFVYEGRRYGLSSDFALVPTDRLRPIQGSTFRGVEIGKTIDFPFAFVRKPGAKFVDYQRSADKLLVAGEAPYRAVVKLTGKQQFFRERLHYETADGKWISDQDASRLDPVRRMPAWGKNGEKWLDVNLTKQTLVAYEGTRAVYATLISSGEAGLEDHTSSTATKRGIFRVHTKHVSSTMASDEVGEEFELRDVPYVQYFEEGYALHGAYWHDRFGTPKSHGCLNLAPEDARWLFSFTEPRVPDGWHAALLPRTGTVIFVHP